MEYLKIVVTILYAVSLDSISNADKKISLSFSPQDPAITGDEVDAASAIGEDVMFIGKRSTTVLPEKSPSRKFCEALEKDCHTDCEQRCKLCITMHHPLYQNQKGVFIENKEFEHMQVNMNGAVQLTA